MLLPASAFPLPRPACSSRFPDEAVENEQKTLFVLSSHHTIIPNRLYPFQGAERVCMSETLFGILVAGCHYVDYCTVVFWAPRFRIVLASDWSDDGARQNANMYTRGKDQEGAICFGPLTGFSYPTVCRWPRPFCVHSICVLDIMSSASNAILNAYPSPPNVFMAFNGS